MGRETPAISPEEPLLGRSTALSCACLSEDRVVFIADRVGTVLSARAEELYRILGIWPEAREVRGCAGLGGSRCVAATDAGVCVYSALPEPTARTLLEAGDGERGGEYFADVCAGSGVLVLSFDAADPMLAHMRVFSREAVEAPGAPCPQATEYSVSVRVGDDRPGLSTGARRPFSLVARRSVCLPLGGGFLVLFWTGAAYRVSRRDGGGWAAERAEFRFSEPDGRDGGAEGRGGPGFRELRNLDMLDALRVPGLWEPPRGEGGQRPEEAAPGEGSEGEERDSQGIATRRR